MRFADKPSAEAAVEAVRKGKSFEQVAKEVATTPAEREVAGDLQFYERGQQGLPPEIETALFAAQLNQVTGPLNLLGSYYLIRVEKKIDPHQYTLDEPQVRDAIRDQLRKQKMEQVVWPNWITDQLNNAKIEVLGSQ
jgi:parvulin-like peptidyl-prolyl isomerase